MRRRDGLRQGEHPFMRTILACLFLCSALCFGAAASERSGAAAIRLLRIGEAAFTSGTLDETKSLSGREIAHFGLETLMNEIAMLGRVRVIGLPDDLFAGTSEKLLSPWRARATTSC